MAFPTLPAEFPPRWAYSGGTISVPTVAKRMLGWVFQEAPPFDFVNWFFNRVGDSLEYLKGYLDVEHDPATGNHTDVYVNSTLDVESTRFIRYVLGAGTPSSRNVVYDFGSPEKAGWQVIAGVLGTDYAYNTGGTPSNTATAAGIHSFTSVRTLLFLCVGQDDAVAGDQWTINQIRINRRRNAAGDAVTYALYSMARNGTVARTTEATVTTATTGAGYATATNAFNIPIDPARVYWIEVVCSSDAASAAGEAGFASVDVQVARQHLE